MTAKDLLPVLSDEGLKNVAEHKYKAGVSTTLDSKLQPFWNMLVEYLPLWLAPNMVTLIGILPYSGAYLLSWLYSPDLSEPIPRWVSLYAAVALFFYQTMDALDGKQARRTKSSSPLGQLFDHGCDCAGCLTHHAVASMAFMPGSTVGADGAGCWPWLLVALLALQTGFFMAQWQEHYTGVLQTNFGEAGVTEMQMGVILLSAGCFLLGPEGQRKLMSREVAVPKILGGGSASPGVLGAQLWAVLALFLTLVSVVKTCRHAHAVAGSARVRRALLDLLPVVSLWVLGVMWNPVALARSPRLILYFTGLVFFYITSQMVLFSMAKMEFRYMQKILILYAELVVCSYAVRFEIFSTLLKLATAAFVAYQALWLYSVVAQLSTGLGVRVFSLEKTLPARVPPVAQGRKGE